MQKTLLLLSIVLLSLLFSPSTYGDSSLFPVEGVIRHRVEFWKKVYTQINSNESFIHDTLDPRIIYKKIKLPNGRRARKRLIKKERNKIKSILRNIAKNKINKLGEDGQKILGLVADKSASELYKMARNIRFQYGLRDRYYKGLIRSYKYLDFIQKTYTQMGLPIELSYLPHVESSFNYKAYSKVGAAGIWQFMRSTARLYGLKVNYIIDERRDPIKATKAAARLLRDNYNRLNSWPLALTAYNHGAQSLVRAIKKLGTTNINTIVQNYKGRRFGFASKNFYATFMATVEISKNPEKYFKSFVKPKKFTFSTIQLNRAYTVDQIAKALKMNVNTIKEYNYEIRPIAYRSPLYLPRNFNFKVPNTTSKTLDKYKTTLKDIKTNTSRDFTEKMHIVSRRETLFDISKIYKVDLHRIIAFNDIDNPSRIFPGMKLKIPGKKTKIGQKILNKKKEPIKVATIKPENKKGKEVFKFDGDLFTKTFGKVFTKKKSDNNTTPIPMILPDINLNSYDLEVNKIKDNYYSIKVEVEETIGHYADWSKESVRTIRRANRKGRSAVIIRGRILIIPMSDKNLTHFKEQRNEYHLSIQEDFFEQFKITGHKSYKVKQGDTLSSILDAHSLPFWLVRQTQKEKLLSPNLKIGQIIKLPILEAKDLENASLPTESNED